MSAMADRLSMAQVALAALEQLGASVGRVEATSLHTIPVIWLEHTGKLKEALATSHKGYFTTGGVSYVEFHECSVAWLDSQP